MKPRDEYVIVKTMGFGLGPRNSGVGLEPNHVYYMYRRYVVERLARDNNLAPDISRYVATGLSYKQA